MAHETKDEKPTNNVGEHDKKHEEKKIRNKPNSFRWSENGEPIFGRGNASTLQ